MFTKPDKKFVTLIYIYTSSVFANEETSPFKIQKGERQGDCLSPILFTAALEEVFKTLPWDEKGLVIYETFLNGEYRRHLRFADDILLFASNAEEMKQRLDELNNAGKKIGLKMNLSKTKVMFNEWSTLDNIHLENAILETCTEYL